MATEPTRYRANRRRPNGWVIAGVALIHVALFYGLIRALAPGAVQTVENSVVAAFSVTVTTHEETPPPPPHRAPDPPARPRRARARLPAAAAGEFPRAW